jgi:hypothetical protein
MNPVVKKLKQEAVQLPQDELIRFSNWCVDLINKRERKAKSEVSTGIHPKDLLKAFRTNEEGGRLSDKFFLVLGASHAAIMFEQFYEETRVDGCRFEDDADMLLVQWGPTSACEYSFSYTRQIIPPGHDHHEIWQLTLRHYYPISDKLKKHKAGSRWFRSLRDLPKFNDFTTRSTLLDLLSESKPRRVSVTYENVE